MPADIVLKLNPNAWKQFHDIVMKETIDIFEKDIVPECVKLSPVTPEGLAINLAQGKTGVLAKGTGHNRQSIDSEVLDEPKGPTATLFTASGYGGYLETGTSKMRAQPYIYPGFKKHIKKLAEYVRERINAL